MTNTNPVGHNLTEDDVYNIVAVIRQPCTWDLSSLITFMNEVAPELMGVLERLAAFLESELKPSFNAFKASPAWHR